MTVLYIRLTAGTTWAGPSVIRLIQEHVNCTASTATESVEQMMDGLWQRIAVSNNFGLVADSRPTTFWEPPKSWRWFDTFRSPAAPQEPTLSQRVAPVRRVPTSSSSSQRRQQKRRHWVQRL